MAGITIQFRRGSTGNHSSFTGAAGELTVDSTTWTVVLHDGSTAGGHRLSKEGHTHTIANITDIHYQTIRRAGSGQTQRARLNFSSLFSATDDSGNDQTTIDINDTGVTGATYGSATAVPVIAVSNKGQITSASNTSIDFTAGFPSLGGNGGKFLGTDASTKAWDHPVTAPAYGSAPAAATGNTGRVVLPGTGYGVRRSTGSAYESFGPMVKMTPPNFGSFSWQNQGGSATSSSSLGAVQIDTGVGEASENLRYMEASLGSAPWKITAAFYPFLVQSASSGECGILIKSNGTGELITVGATWDGDAVQLVSTKWDDDTTPNSTYFTSTMMCLSMPIYVQIEDDGADRFIRLSMNGAHWFPVHSTTNSNFLAARDRYGFYVSSRAGSTRAAMTLVSLELA